MKILISQNFFWKNSLQTFISYPPKKWPQDETDPICAVFKKNEKVNWINNLK